VATNSVTVRVPAKVNLQLSVGPRENDGFHGLVTVFQAISIYDDLTITHAGMNTTLECLTNGVPMVAIPIANDQPGVASRIVWSGCGEAIPVKKVNVDNLRTAIKKVLTEDSYRKNALQLQEAIKKAGGTKRAIDIVEQAVSTGKPVLNQKV
jgi:MGT family glycosyltransferase